MIYDIAAYLQANAYPGRGIIVGKSADGQQIYALYFIMGRSANSRNRVFAYTEDGIQRIAEIAVYDNANHEDIGARRLHALMEKLLEEVSFAACGNEMKVTVDAKYVDEHLNTKSLKEDLRRYII